jgi:biotin carboxylase
MIRKTLLVVGAGVEQVPLIQKARKMGLFVVASDMNPKAIGFKFANANFISSTYDLKQTVKEAIFFNRKHRKINGVMTVASDVPLTVASVAAALNLPGNSIETATIAQDKLLMKETFRKYGVPIPWFLKIKNFSHLKSVVVQRGFPLVIKPVDSRGARGVLLLTKDVDLELAYQESKANSPTGRVMVEEFLEGKQISTESFLYDGFSITPGIADRNYELLDKYAPYMLENGGELPSTLPRQGQNAIKKTAETAASVMGIVRNSAKGDMVFTKEGPKVIEIAARLSGGYYSTHEIPLNTGVDLVKAVIKVTLGETVDLKSLIPEYKNVLVQRYFFPKPGSVLKIIGEKEAENLPYVKLFRLYIKTGDIVKQFRNHTERAGVVTVMGSNRQQAYDRMRFVFKMLKIITK